MTAPATPRARKISRQSIRLRQRQCSHCRVLAQQKTAPSRTAICAFLPSTAEACFANPKLKTKQECEPLSHRREHQIRAAFVQPIAIFRGWVCFAFGRMSVNTPSSPLLHGTQGASPLASFRAR